LRKVYYIEVRVLLVMQVTLQAGLVLCNFLLHSFALTRLENVHHFSNLRYNFWSNVIWHRQYMIIFSLTQIGIHAAWRLLSCVGG